MLAVHETAEEEIVHPSARRSGIDQGIVDNRLAEYHHRGRVVDRVGEN